MDQGPAALHSRKHDDFSGHEGRTPARRSARISQGRRAARPRAQDRARRQSDGRHDDGRRRGAQSQKARSARARALDQPLRRHLQGHHRRRKDARFLGAQFALQDRRQRRWSAKGRAGPRGRRHDGRPRRRDFRRTRGDQRVYRQRVLKKANPLTRRESADPLVKIETPGPPFFAGHRCRSRASTHRDWLASRLHEGTILLSALSRPGRHHRNLHAEGRIMIWNSVSFMTAIDLLIIAVAIYGIWRCRRFIPGRRPSASRIGVWLIASGLLVVGLFYAADLISMHALPAVMSEQEAMALMNALHRHLSWLVVLLAVITISTGFVKLLGELEEREARARRLVDSNIIGVFIWGPDGRIIDANEAFLSMVGYGRDDLVSSLLRWRELTPAEWGDADDRRAAELKAIGTVQPYEKEFLHKNGNRVPVLVGAANFEGRGDEGVAFVIDLTDRKRAERQCAKVSGDTTRHRWNWRTRTASQRWGSCRPRSPMRSTSRSARRSPTRRPPCAGWAPARLIWMRSGRRSTKSSRTANEPARSSTGSVPWSRRRLRTRIDWKSTKQS